MVAGSLRRRGWASHRVSIVSISNFVVIMGFLQRVRNELEALYFTGLVWRCLPMLFPLFCGVASFAKALVV